MIPKIIHYCWFGTNPLPNEVLICIESWKKYCPDYEIILWNEKNFPINEFVFATKAYENNRFAFVSDVARIYALHKFGGIYMDTDMELIKPIDDLLNNDAVIGFEDQYYIAAGIIGSVKNNHFIKEIFNFYTNAIYVDFSDSNYKLNKSSFLNFTIPKIITHIIDEKSFDINSNEITKIVDYCTFYPVEYFYPKNYRNGILNITKNTYGIHHYDASWQDDKNELETTNNRILYYFQKIKEESLDLETTLSVFKKVFKISNKNLIKHLIFNSILKRFK